MINASPIPLYHQVFGILRQRIVDGVYPVGGQLAPEDELAAEFEVSRATVRQAVGELVSAGLVSRKQGRGTFVLASGSKSLGQRFRGSLADLIAETKRAAIRNVAVTHDVTAPAAVADALALETPTVTIVRRTRTMDRVPFAYTVNYLPPAYGKLVSERELKSHGLMQLLQSKGIEFAGATQAIRAQLADVNIGGSLELDPGAPVLFVQRMLVDRSDQPIELVQSWYRGDVYEYTVTFDRGSDQELDIERQFA